MFLTGSDSIYFGVEKSRAAVALISGFAALPTQQILAHHFTQIRNRGSELRRVEQETGTYMDPGTMLITLCSLRTWTGKDQLRLFGAWRKPYFFLHYVM